MAILLCFSVCRMAHSVAISSARRSKSSGLKKQLFKKTDIQKVFKSSYLRTAAKRIKTKRSILLVKSIISIAAPLSRAAHINASSHIHMRDPILKVTFRNGFKTMTGIERHKMLLRADINRLVSP